MRITNRPLSYGRLSIVIGISVFLVGLYLFFAKWIDNLSETGVFENTGGKSLAGLLAFLFLGVFVREFCTKLKSILGTVIRRRNLIIITGSVVCIASFLGYEYAVGSTNPTEVGIKLAFLGATLLYFWLSSVIIIKFFQVSCPINSNSNMNELAKED